MATGHQTTGPVSTREHLLDRLRQVRARDTRLHILATATSLIAALLLVCIILTAIESAAYLSPTIKSSLLGGVALLVAVVIGYGVCLPLWRPMDLLDISRRMEAVHPALGQHLTNAVQLRHSKDQPGVSPDLIDAAILQAAHQTDPVDLITLVDTTSAKTGGRRLGLSIVLALLATQLLPGHGVDALSRLADPTGRYARPQETHIHIAPGDTILISGDSLTIDVDIAGVVPLNAHLLIREADETDWTSTDIPVRGNAATHLTRTVRNSFSYRWRIHDAVSQDYHVLARPRPVVLDVSARYTYPTYTGLPDRTDHEGGDIAVLTGTRVTLGIRASRPLSDARLSFEQGGKVAARTHADSAEVTFTVDRLDRFTIGLTDTIGIRNAEPVNYRVLPLEDEPPTIVALRPGTDSELGERMQVPLLFEATDDFGVDRVDIVFRVNDLDTMSVTVPLDTPGNRELTQAYGWDLSSRDLLPGDEVHYRLRALDINRLTGPRIGETPEYVVRFPSLQEIQEAARHAQEETVEQLGDVVEQSRDIQERMENVAREILKNEEASWEDRAEIRDALQQQEALRQQIDESVQALEETRQRLEQSGLLTSETAEKIDQVRQLMEQLNSPKLEAITRDLQSAVDNVDPEMIREAIERLTEEQEAFQSSLDRTIALLERVRNEQMLDALAARMRDLATDQEEIYQSLDSDTAPESLAERQSSQSREADHLQETLKEAAEEIDQARQALGDLVNQFDRHRITERSDQSARDLKAGQRERAQTGTKTLFDDLARMADDLERIRDAHRQIQKDKLLSYLCGIFRDALELSRSQERAASDTMARSKTDEQIGQSQTRDLNAAARLAQRVLDATQKTFLVPPEAGTGLKNAIQQMQSSLGHLQRGQGDQAGQDAREAMAGLNGAAMAIREAMAAVKAAGSSTGMDEMLQQLANASDRQSDLNAETEGMMGQPRPGGQSGGGLPQLSAEQRAIQQMLQELRDKFGAQEGQALGDLGRISEDMDDVVERLSRNQLDQPTVERQRRVLSRMLDAQRSIRQRGYSNNREARAGVDVAYRGPGTLPSSLGERDNPLRSLQRQALRQGYPDDYESLIRGYFDRLIEDAAGKETAP